MKIGIDARICDEWWYYWQYCWELIVAFCRTNTEHEIVVYRWKDIVIEIERTLFVNIPYNRVRTLEEWKARRKFQKEKFSLMIFFDHHIPHYFKWNYIVFIESLKEVFFPKKKFFARRSYQFKLQKAIKHAEHVIVMDGGSALELNERLNIPEEKIEKIHGFFPQVTTSDITQMSVDVGAKHNLRWKYFIYDSWNEMHNNFDRILKTIHKLKEKELILYLIILCEETNKDLDIRSKSIEYDIADQIIFLWKVDPAVESSYYSQSAWVIFSSIYESFPFHFSKALSYGVPIFANDIPANKEVMWSTITYLDPLSIHNITDAIAQAISFPKVPDYSPVTTNFSAKKSAYELHRILDLKD